MQIILNKQLEEVKQLLLKMQNAVIQGRLKDGKKSRNEVFASDEPSYIKLCEMLDECDYTMQSYPDFINHTFTIMLYNGNHVFTGKASFPNSWTNEDLKHYADENMDLIVTIIKNHQKRHYQLKL